MVLLKDGGLYADDAGAIELQAGIAGILRRGAIERVVRGGGEAAAHQGTRGAPDKNLNSDWQPPDLAPLPVRRRQSPLSSLR